jgi:transposase-like protein
VNIIERGRAFAKRLRELATGSVWDWKQCPQCGSRVTIKYGAYTRHPWGFEGRDTVRVQRHLCHACHQTYGESSPWLVRRSWYYRGVHRAAVDHWQHLGTSLRRTAEVLRSWMGHQERWLLWHPLAAPRGERCKLSASTVHRWLDGAGQRAAESVPGQLAGIGETHELGTDGLWARLKGQVVRVVLMTVDSVSGLIYPPVVAQNEERAEVWGHLLERAQGAGLDLQKLRGICSDGANGLLSYLRNELTWVEQQRCVWHIWRGLSGNLGRAVSQAVQGLPKEAVEAARKAVRAELVQLIRGVIDAQQAEAAESALQQLLAHPHGRALGQHLSALMDRLFVYQMDYCRGVQRVSPEWYWRDFRLRLSHGRNHRSEQRLERAALLWAVYHNFEPAQWRSEHQRHYRHPGKSALQVAGVPPGQVSYLDALGV